MTKPDVGERPIDELAANLFGKFPVSDTDQAERMAVVLVSIFRSNLVHLSSE